MRNTGQDGSRKADVAACVGGGVVLFELVAFLVWVGRESQQQHTPFYFLVLGR